MEQPSPPTSLPKYLAEGLPKQDTETLQEVQNYIEALIEYRDQSVDTDELPEAAEPVNESESAGSGTVVKKKSPVATTAVNAQVGVPRICTARISIATIVRTGR